MKTLVNKAVLGAFVVVGLSAVALGQPSPDTSLWGGGATNPSGDTAVPVVYYDPMTGIMSLDTVGLNRTSDTTTGQMIGGDDVGTISLSVTGPAATSVILNGFVNQPIGGVVWNGQYFNGKQQLFGVGAGAEYLQPALKTDAFQYAAGLTESAFGGVDGSRLGAAGGVEMAVNFASGAPGDTIFGAVQFVPEPSAMLIVGPALLGLIGFLRRRR